MMQNEEKNRVYRDFNKAVNMTAGEIESFLSSENSKAVGQSDGSGESIGHKSGRRIILILKKNKTDLTDDDYNHMKRVIGYVARHMAQGGPEKDKQHSKWRYSLMNWGHDPCK